jgi:hypothetical protein
MICDRCLKELNAAFEFAERSRSAEKLFFVKLREGFEADQQEPEQTKKAEVKAIDNEREKLRLAVSEPSDDSEMSYESEASDKMDKDSEREEETPQMFAIQATADSSLTS